MAENKQKKKQAKKKDNKKIYRYPNAGWLGGVCAGIAYRFKIQTWIIRLITFLAILFLEFPLIVYILCWIFIPKKETPGDYDKVCT